MMSIPTWKNTLRVNGNKGVLDAQQAALRAEYEYFTHRDGGVVYRSAGNICIDGAKYEGSGVTGWTTDDVERFSKGALPENVISVEIVRAWRREQLSKFPKNSQYSLDQQLAVVYRKVLAYIAGGEEMHNMDDSSAAELAAASLDG